MKINYIIIGALLFLLSSCSKQATLYSWGSKKKTSYFKTSYSYLKKSNTESMEMLKLSYEDIINNQKGIRKTVPPGIYADYGFLLLENNDEKGKDFLKKEMILYPESKIFISRILKMLEK
tara:strand:+ start:297 stop:656 length:360 start_codon:yes stop_codon:yes gene_type:complete